MRHKIEPAAAALSSSAVPAGSPAAATGAAAAATAAAAEPLWQRIEERYNTAQRGAAATMFDTNTGGDVGLAWRVCATRVAAAPAVHGIQPPAHQPHEEAQAPSR